MSARGIAWALVIGSIIASALGYGMVGLFLVIAAVAVAMVAPSGPRADARRRNRH